ncbi:GntR family transcriptional regulator, partial [Streptomyces sp. NRRL S-481]|uniref:GntR family transcriptional regulator n=1 Tax=Streptomyces sp. NRRL S-481 TaxID=1463911 RepID=UPI0004C71346
MAPKAPKWRELADRFAEQIRSGQLKPDQQLPQIRELVEAGEGSKETVHRAYKALEAEGLVTMSRGHGTTVRPKAPLKRLGIARYDKAKWRDGDEVAFIADRVASGRTYSRNEQTQSVSRVKAPAAVAEAHGLPEGAYVYARARLVKEGTQPTHTLTSYYRPEHVEGTRIVDATPGPAGRGGG